MTAIDGPLVTIGITCYNAEDTIARAVASARAQDWPNIEILVVDDLSGDNSYAVLEALAAEDTRIRLVRHQQNAGPGAARQTIVDAASGEYIAFIDDDDESAPQRISTQLQRLQKYRPEGFSGPVACYASGQRIYQNGYTLDVDAIGSNPEAPVGTQVVDYLLFNERVPGRFYGAGTPTCALMMRRSDIQAVGGFDPGMRRVEDADLAVRLGLAGCHFIGCPERLYTQYATQGSDKSAGMNLAAELALVEKHRSYLEQRGRYHYARNWYQFRAHHFKGERLQAVGAFARVCMRNPITALRHLARTGPARWVHERRMRKQR